MEVSLKRIKYFVTVARSNHFGRAAKELHVSQPPLSQQIRLLEKELGVDLFVRTTRRVELTEAGRVLYEGARSAVDDLKRVIVRAQSIHHGNAGRLRIGFVSTSTFHVLPETLTAFRNSFPEATLELFHMTSSQQAEAFQKGQIDVGFLRTVPPGVASMVVQREPFLVALPVNHPLAKKRLIDVKALATEPFVMWDRKQTHGIASDVLALCEKHGFVPRIILEVTNPAAMLSVVAGRMGVAIVPSSALQLRQAALAFRSLNDADAYSQLALAWSSENGSGLLKQFVSLVRTRTGEKKRVVRKASA